MNAVDDDDDVSYNVMPCAPGISTAAFEESTLDPYVNLFASFLLRVLPPDRAQLLADELAAALPGVLSSPVTAMHAISEKISSVFSEADLQAIKREFLWGFPSFWLEWARTQVAIDEEKMEIVNGHQPAKELMEALFEMYSEASSKPDFIPTFQNGLASMDVLKHAAALGRLFELPDDTQVSFERRARAIASALSDLAENFYKPYLQLCLRLTRVHAGAEPTAPSMLGSVLQECGDAWRNRWPGLLLLLDDNVRLIRNSESHTNTIYDLDSVTFVNERNTGEKQILGPLRASEFPEFAHGVENNFVALQAAVDCTFRRIWMMHQAVS